MSRYFGFSLVVVVPVLAAVIPARMSDEDWFFEEVRALRPRQDVKLHERGDDGDDDDRKRPSTTATGSQTSSTFPSQTSRPLSRPLPTSATSTTQEASTITRITTLPTATKLLGFAPPQQIQQTHAEETREHWVIAVSAVVAFIFIAAVVFTLFRFRRSLAARFSRKKPTPEKTPVITGPVGGWSHRAPTSTECSDHHVSHLFGAPTTIDGYGAEPQHAVFNQRTPPRALAPSTAGLEIAASRRLLVRGTLLPAAQSSANKDRFHLDAELREQRRRPDALSLTIPGGRVAFPRGKPESPDAAAARKKYSWVTPVSGKSARTSIESQPVRFRTVDSWVSLQALRAGTVGKAEVTPVECRANPGSAVAYSEEGRVEGRVLDGLGLSL